MLQPHLELIDTFFATGETGLKQFVADLSDCVEAESTEAFPVDMHEELVNDLTITLLQGSGDEQKKALLMITEDWIATAKVWSDVELRKEIFTDIENPPATTLL